MTSASPRHRLLEMGVREGGFGVNFAAQFEDYWGGGWELCGGPTPRCTDPVPHSSRCPSPFQVFGDKTELLINRDAEKLLLLQLNAAGFGAPVWAGQRGLGMYFAGFGRVGL